MASSASIGTPRAQVSVVVAAYNAASTLGPCLESLLAQDYPDELYEVVVVDNGSDDRTCEIARSFSPRVSVLHEAVRGAGAARNCGVANTEAALLAFVDADCVADSGWLSALVGGLEDESVGVQGGRILALRPCSWIAQWSEKIHDHRRALGGLPPYAISMNWACRRDAFEKVGGFDPALVRGQDVELSFRFTIAGYALRYKHDAVVYHRNRESLGALWREGHAHGRAALAIRRVQGSYLAQFGPVRSVPARLAGVLRHLISGSPFRSALLSAFFELAKISGELRGEIAGPSTGGGSR